MNIWKQTFLFCVLMLGNAVTAQTERLKLDASSHVVLSSNDIRPLWLVSNEWGRFDQFGKAESLIELGGSYEVYNGENFTLNAGIRGLVNFDINNSRLQEAYVNGRLWFMDYSMGKEQYSPLVYNDKLTSGQYLMNSNAQPIPRITLGIFNYLPLGFTNNWVEVKGAMSHGWMNDDRIEKSNSANDLFLHEKFAYVRLGNTKFQPYAGLVHSALYGGTRPNGDEIPIDFWATFFAKGSAKLGGGEETNAAGAHMGMWDFGFDWSHQWGDIHFYFQKPFADGSGMFINHGQNKDYIAGVVINPKELNWLSGVSLEIIKTDYQSGEGIPDPLYPADYEKEGLIVFDQIDDYDQFMYDVFGEETSGWGKQDVVDYMVVHENHGYRYGGRDDYMNNGSYYNGWSYNGMNMGTPLYHSADMVRRYAHPWSEVDQVYFYNTRVNGFHIGAEGQVLPGLSYRLKSTFTINKGSYGEKYRGRYSWVETDNYFFATDKKQTYSMLELNWQTPWLEGLSLSGKIAIDAGQLYNSSGGMISINYVPNFK